MTVGKSDASAGGVDGELFHQVSGQLLFVGQKMLLQFADVVEGPTIGQLPRGIHGQADAITHDETVMPNALSELPFSLVDRPIAIAPSPHHIKVFQSKARRIDLNMADIAALLGAMQRQLLANGLGSPDIGIDGLKLKAVEGE